MMSYLLDTHALIWALTEPEKLSRKVRTILEDPLSSISVSSLTFWEISIKYALGKLELEVLVPQDFYQACREMRFDIQELSAEEASTYHLLNATHHKDPFDRMLVWQCLKNNHILISQDEDMKKYVSEGLKIYW